MKERIAADRAKVQQRIDKWASLENFCTQVGLEADAAYCAYIRSHLEELVACFDEMERVAV